MNDEGKRYRHYKGGLYEVVAHALREDTEEPVVVYRSLQDGKVWVRAEPLFYGEQEWQGQTVKRFTRVVE